MPERANPALSERQSERKWYLLVDPKTGLAHEVADDKDAAESNAPFWGCVVVEVGRTGTTEGAIDAGRAQWLMAHGDRCTGRADAAGCSLGDDCHWPIPAALRGWR